MIKSISVLFFFAFTFASFASQPPIYYYADDNKIELHEDANTIILHFAPERSNEIARMSLPGLLNLEVHDVYGRAILTFDRDVLASEFNAVRIGIPAADFYSAVQGFVLDDGFKVALTHDVVAEFADAKVLHQPQVTRLASHFGATYQRDEYGTSIFRVSDPIQGLHFANKLVEEGMVRWAHSDIYAKITRYNDPFFGEQFQMQNTGQVVNGFAGVAGIDINAVSAWAISTGNASITIAVIDDGLEEHEDLEDENNTSRILPGHTPATSGGGTPRFNDDGHGMACAGIVAATHNNAKGVRGVAPNTKLRSVNIFWGGETAQTIANGINWARNQGVDVMTNSWGYTSCTISFSSINNALNNARNNGRGGKGCIVVFASGNGGKTCIDYPANHSAVLAVGAITNQGNWSTYSNRGPELSLVAPSDADFGQAGASVRTIDRMGSAGYSLGNYTATFGGTSAACPAVAGVAALLLAVDPDITEAEVRIVLQTTATDMGAVGFDNTFGYGRVNAGAALESIGVPPISTCEDEELTLTLVLDNYPAETTWQLVSANGVVEATGGNYAGSTSGTVVVETFCLPAACYTFTIFDSWGDGICCQFGNGSYSLTNAEDEVLASGGQFTSSEATEICLGGPEAPPCENPYPAIQNLQAVVQANGVALSWDPIEGSIACQINGSRSNGNGDRTFTITGSNLSSFFVPAGQLPATTNYRVRVRCACSTSPPIAGPWSPYTIFFFTVSSGLQAQVALADVGNSTDISIWPNPTMGDVNLELTTEMAGEASIILYDMLGKAVYARKVTLDTGRNRVREDFSHLQPALYVLRIDGEGGLSKSERLIIGR